MRKDKNELYRMKSEALREKNPFMSNTDIAYKMILEMILDGVIAPGERVPQDLLAELLGMSKTPIRDAILRLETEGFIDKSDKSGYQVADVEYRDYLNFCDFRRIIESNAAYYAAINITIDELKKLQDCHERMHKAVEKQAVEQFIALDEEFHWLIVQASHNSFLIDAYLGYMGKRKFYTSIRVRGNENYVRFKNKHDDIYQAIVHNREMEAKKAMESHLSGLHSFL